jgi:hypothetical protein
MGQGHHCRPNPPLSRMTLGHWSPGRGQLCSVTFLPQVLKKISPRDIYMVIKMSRQGKPTWNTALILSVSNFLYGKNEWWKNNWKISLVDCVTFPSLCVVVCVFACVYFRKWLPEIPQAADWSTPWIIGELTPPPRQDVAVSSYTFILKLYKSQCPVQKRVIAGRSLQRDWMW